MSVRRRLIPEAIQTSAMDCGPAALKALLEGHGIRASYGRLREACQTEVDGTSIDVLEEVAVRLGLDAEQIVIPADHLLLEEANALPALVVVRLADGRTHFVVAWQRHGGRVQLMDPGTGRRWPRAAGLLADLYIHEMAAPAADWRAWAGEEEFRATLQRRLRDLGVDAGAARDLIAAALEDPGWRPIATLDAAARTAAKLRAAGALRGAEAAALVPALLARAGEDAAAIPPGLWSARAAEPGDDGEEQVLIRGAIAVRVKGRLRNEATGAEALTPELAAALREPPSRPGRTLWQLIAGDGAARLAVLATAAALFGVVTVIEPLLLRGFFDLTRDLALPGQRLGALLGLGTFAVAALGVDLARVEGMLRAGRHLETRLRIAFLTKLPRLADRYFGSRPASDMAERSHSTHLVREIPALGAEALTLATTLALTSAGVVWLDPPSWPYVLAILAAAVGLPLLAQPALGERTLRVRVHRGALGTHQLDGLLGLTALRAHAAERALRREHEALLGEWVQAGWSTMRAALALEGAQQLLCLGLSAAALAAHLERSGASGLTLLLAWWLLLLPALGAELAVLARRYPDVRNVTLRLLEPLGAPEAPRAATELGEHRRGAVALHLEGVSVQAAGHAILEELELKIAPGSHVAVVGPSGAGKSSLLGLFLGWHAPTSGRALADGEPIAGAALDALRRATAWVDPSVQLWNQTLLENLLYGVERGAPPLADAFETAELAGILERLPNGLQTPLGEGGASISGGEGQRVRLARAALRSDARLVLLDEPFRGLDRERRRALLSRSLALWQEATLLCVTHDLAETLDFDRVLVIDGGRIVEDGPPAELAARPQGRYRALLDAEAAARTRLWEGEHWRRLRLVDGRLEEREAPVEGAGRLDHAAEGT